MSYSVLKLAHYIDLSTGDLFSSKDALCNLKLRYVPDFEGGYTCTSATVCSRPIYNPRGLSRIYDEDVHFRSPIRGDEDDPDNVDRSRRRARRAVRDYMDCNRFQYFMTFTLNAERIDRDDYTAFVKSVNKYLGNRVQRYGWFYVAVPEYHHDGKALHLHAVVGGDRFKLADSGAVIRPCGGKPVKVATALRQGYRRDQLKTVYNVTDWTLGFSTAIEVYGGRKALTNYILKYITKSDCKIGGRWYFSGGNLQKPLYKYDNVDYDLIESDHEFSNNGGNFKVIYYDD